MFGAARIVGGSFCSTFVFGSAFFSAYLRTYSFLISVCLTISIPDLDMIDSSKALISPSTVLDELRLLLFNMFMKDSFVGISVLASELWDEFEDTSLTGKND